MCGVACALFTQKNKFWENDCNIDEFSEQHNIVVREPIYRRFNSKMSKRRGGAPWVGGFNGPDPIVIFSEK